MIDESQKAWRRIVSGKEWKHIWEHATHEDGCEFCEARRKAYETVTTFDREYPW